MSLVERRFLKRLRNSDDHTVLVSSVAAGCKQVLRDLEACGAIRQKVIRRAARVEVVNLRAFESFIESRHPLGIDASLNDVFDRAGAVIAFGDAKAIKTGAEQGIFIRTAKSNIAVREINGADDIPVGKLSTYAGGAALILNKDRKWEFSGSVAVIENAQTFWQHEKVLPDVDLAVYASGKMSGRLVQWLTSAAMSECEIIHWGDYDPCGVMEYLRLYDKCPDRVTSFVPANIDGLMKYGKRKLLSSQSRALEKLRTRVDNHHVTEMLKLFDKHRKGLEQEVLL